MPGGVLKAPLNVEVSVHPTPHQPEVRLGPALASAHLQRWFSSPQQSRARLRTGRLRGVFLLPPDVPFPGLIDMFRDRGLDESRASLLACRGFAALALLFFGYEDLPPIMKDLNLNYFEEAAKFVQNHPKGSGMLERSMFKIKSLTRGDSTTIGSGTKGLKDICNTYLLSELMDK